MHWPGPRGTKRGPPRQAGIAPLDRSVHGDGWRRYLSTGRMKWGPRQRENNADEDTWFPQIWSGAKGTSPFVNSQIRTFFSQHGRPNLGKPVRLAGDASHGSE